MIENDIVLLLTKVWIERMVNSRRKWSPKGGELEVVSQLVEIDDIVGSHPVMDAPRPDSGNTDAKRAMGDISLAFIMNEPITPEMISVLGTTLPSELPSTTVPLGSRIEC